MELPMSDFWPTVWRLGRRLGADPPDLTTPDDSVEELRDLRVQRYVFVHLQFKDPTWLAVFRRLGVFTLPPPVERVGGTLRAQGWPAMTYLANVALPQSQEVAEILEGKLPPEYATNALLHALDLWQSTDSPWTDRRSLVAALDCLADSGDLAALAEGVFRIASRIWDVRSVGYEVADALAQTQSQHSPDCYGAIADGIELAISYRILTSDLWEGASLDNLARQVDDPLSHLVSTWLDAAEAEAKNRGESRALVRALRLLPLDHALARQLGLRALRLALSGVPRDATAKALLIGLSEDRKLLVDYNLAAELLPLFRDYWEELPLQGRASWIEDLLSIATSEHSRTEAYAARDWLAHLRPHLGDREQLALEQLETELGPARMNFSDPHVSGIRIGPEGPVSAEEISNLAAEDLLALMRYVPHRTSDHFGPSSEGLGRQLRPEIERRPEEFLPLLNDIADSVPYSSIIYNVIWGLDGAYKREENRSPGARAAIIEFLERTLRNADIGQYEDDDRAGPAAIPKVTADLIENLAPWLVEAPEHKQLTAIIARTLGDQDPTEDFEQQFGGENMDPPTLSLNTARGRGVRAALSLLTHFWRDESSSDFRAELERLLFAHSHDERSPSVLSAYGLHLPGIITYWSSFWSDRSSDLLPTGDEREAVWEAVFTTYVIYHGVHLTVAGELVSHYDRAVARVNDARYRFLRKHASQVLVHLITVSMIESDTSREWERMLGRAIATFPADAVATAASELAHALRERRVEISSSWVGDLVSARLSARRGEPFDHQEGRALADLIFAANAPVSATGGMVLDLIERAPSLDGDGLLSYLAVADPSRTALGATILEAAVNARLFEGYLSDRSVLQQAVESYAAVDPERSWRMVNALGAEGMYDLDDLARRISPRQLEA